MAEKPIQEQLLGESTMGIFFDSANPDTDPQIIHAKMCVYQCPQDRRAIVKDVRAVWNPDEEVDVTDIDTPGAMGYGQYIGDKRVLEIKVNKFTVARTQSDGVDTPPAVYTPNFEGGHGPSIVMEPGERLEVSIGIDVTTTPAGGDRLDEIICRASGVEVLL